MRVLRFFVSNIFAITLALSFSIAASNAQSQVIQDLGNVGTDFSRPKIAYDPVNQRYLSVYARKATKDERSSAIRAVDAEQIRIFGQFFDNIGNKQGEEILISKDRPTEVCLSKKVAEKMEALGPLQLPAEKDCPIVLNPDIAYNNGNFFIVWELRGVAPQVNIRPFNQFSNIIGMVVDANDFGQDADDLTPLQGWEEGQLLNRSFLGHLPVSSVQDKDIFAWSRTLHPRVAARKDGEQGRYGFMLTFESNYEFTRCFIAERRLAWGIYSRAISIQWPLNNGDELAPQFKTFVHRSVDAAKCEPLKNIFVGRRPEIAFNQSTDQFVSTFACSKGSGGKQSLCAKNISPMGNGQPEEVDYVVSPNWFKATVVASDSISLEQYDIAANQEEFALVTVAAEGVIKAKSLAHDRLHNRDALIDLGVKGLEPSIAANILTDAEGDVPATVALAFRPGDQEDKQVAVLHLGASLNRIADALIVSGPMRFAHHPALASDAADFLVVWGDSPRPGADDIGIAAKLSMVIRIDDLDPPPAPSWLATRDQDLTHSSVNLRWRMNENTVRFQLLRVEGACPAAEQNLEIGVAGAVEVQSDIDGNETEYSDGNLSPETAYCYQLFAYNASPRSPSFSIKKSYTTNEEPEMELVPPTNLAVQVIDRETLAISWRLPAAFPQAQVQVARVQQAAEACNFRDDGADIVHTSAAAELSHQDTNLNNNVTYCYRLRLYIDDETVSNWGAPQSASPAATPDANPVTNLSFDVARIPNGDVRLSWEHVGQVTDAAFIIRRGRGLCSVFENDASLPDVLVADQSTNTLNYSDASAQAGRNYCYEVAVTNGDRITEMARADRIAIDLPAALPVLSINAGQLSFNYLGDDNPIQGFTLYRGNVDFNVLPAGDERPATTVCAAVATNQELAVQIASPGNVQDPNRTAGNIHCYQVAANYSWGTAAKSNIVGIELPPSQVVLTAPPNGEVVAPTRVTLHWNAAEGSNVVYDVYFPSITGTYFPLNNPTGGGFRINAQREIIEDLGISETEYLITPDDDDVLLPGGIRPGDDAHLRRARSYKWQIVARNKNRNTDSSRTRFYDFNDDDVEPEGTGEFSTNDSVVLWFRFSDNPNGFDDGNRDLEWPCRNSAGLDRSRTICDYSGHGNHGIPMGDITWNEEENYLEFDGIDDYIEVPDSVSLNPEAAISIYVDQKLTEIGGEFQDRPLVSKFDSQEAAGGSGYAFGLGWGLEMFAFMDGATSRLDSAGILDEGSKYLLIFDSSEGQIDNLSVYQDGIDRVGLHDLAADANTSLGSGIPLWIGKSIRWNGIYKGDIKEIIIFQDAILEADRARLFE